MQTLSGYKFKYGFVKGELNILPVPGSLPQTQATAPVVTPQLLATGPVPSSEAAPPLALPGMLLYDVLLAQHSSPDGQAICTKLFPDSASNGPYTLKDRIIYQNRLFRE
ncbi:hypothetical protein DSO57_1019234 [Entomophthora muscae]|uniref:Uncharacterized protein n=1 Tax=Entomophthora muscae TaxID=34485 RepID=A0ACC2TF34_9FUNG|nr:hypothetical protein DSO57_1019234 [Entomophthora muscae]